MTSFYFENRLNGDTVAVKNTTAGSIAVGTAVTLPLTVVEKDTFVGVALDTVDAGEIIPTARKGSFVLVSLVATHGATDKWLVKLDAATRKFQYLSSTDQNSLAVGYVLYEKTINGVLYGYAYIY